MHNISFMNLRLKLKKTWKRQLLAADELSDVIGMTISIIIDTAETWIIA